MPTLRVLFACYSSLKMVNLLVILSILNIVIILLLLKICNKVVLSLFKRLVFINYNRVIGVTSICSKNVSNFMVLAVNRYCTKYNMLLQCDLWEAIFRCLQVI
jgi:hypothetical protein